MSLHKLTAGSGYDYLTRQVAAADSTEKGHASLASYYSEKGETPGQWIGTGLAGIDGLDAGDVVTAEQMQALFGSGHHPLAAERRNDLEDDATAAQLRAVTRLGTPFKVYTGDVSDYRIEVARRLDELNVVAGLPRGAAISTDVRARVRSEVAREYFIREHGREPADARELAATVAKHSRPKTTAVAGFDLTFSPVKSVSTLWAIADPNTAAKIEHAHRAAVKDALAFIERDALYTRVGTDGVRQVDVTGLVAAAFTHRDSRSGDPDLHTHVAVANKVQTADGRWLAIDGRVLFKAKVTASETYNTALEQHLSTALGVRFAMRAGTDTRKRPVREIVGVDPVLNERWSSRRASIVSRQTELAATFQHDHGRPPTPVEAITLAQQATLETRDPKHEPRTVAEQRTTWRDQAIDTLGGANVLDRMVGAALSPRAESGLKVTADYVGRTGAIVVGEVQARRSTWQVWHLRAEAQRQIRGSNIPANQIDAVVDLIVDAALARSVALTTDRDPISEPELLRRRDGRSVYHVAGSDVFTSGRILDAEARIVAAAGHTGGRSVAAETVDIALLESTANGIELNAGQAALVRQMATSGARVQLGIAAAGTGKTTAMRVLTRAWEEDGGTVVGLAPSAAAAAALADHTGATTDTLAKLLHHLTNGSHDNMAGRIGAGTLVLIDEAGMADTLSLDAVIGVALERGASVRLIGDDQQLAAIGAGGVLRDIDTTYGALGLAELMRFTDPAEGAATLALRDGRSEALGFYLDNQRIHVGDLTTLTDNVFERWQADKTAGVDALMLAPTRELAAELNARARQSRLANTGHPGLAVRLADGNNASVGDVVITRANDRRLRASATDWVKNGDRWHITTIDNGRLALRHTRSGLAAVLPTAYVAAHTELGYASTVHTAQGLSVDTMHGLATGDESRQQFYTMMTRGRHSNDVYLVIAGDGDPHSLIRPETIHPPTATDILEDILARDGTPRSATTLAAEAEDPHLLLGHAAARYVDALSAGAEHLIGTQRIYTIEQNANDVVPGVADESAWLALRAHLILLEADGHDADSALASAVAMRELDGARDRAAILDWRLNPAGMRGTAAGPLPWLPAIPANLAADPTFGPYLEARAGRVASLATQVRDHAASDDPPAWANHRGQVSAPDVLADVAVWRAATSVNPDDRRPTGPPQHSKVAANWQRRLDERVNASNAPALAEWGPAIDALCPEGNEFTPLLAEHLASISRTGMDAAALLYAAAAEGSLPDDHAAAALWWRINRRLSPKTATEATARDIQITTNWSELLVDTFGADRATQIAASPWYPTLITSVDDAIGRGWTAHGLLDTGATVNAEDVNLVQAIVWRIAILTDPPPETEPPPETGRNDRYGPPEDVDEAFPITGAKVVSADPIDVDHDPASLGSAVLARELAGPVEPDDADINRMLERAYEWDHAPVTGTRILQINELAATYYERHLQGSWAHMHLAERLGHDIAGDQRFRPGYAPPGWTNVINHLRQTGVSEDEMIAAGLVKTASTGNLIDRFRDRAILPIISNGEVLGFVGRRHPDATDDSKTGPKYLNTPTTVAFSKGAQLYGLADPQMADGSIPVLVEGPMDAIAITVATAGAYIGLAPLGTALTDEQTAELGRLGVDPIVATDGDTAGQIAAERDYWMLTPHKLEPKSARFDPGEDPASVLADNGPTALRAALYEASPLASMLIDERISNMTGITEQLTETAQIISAQPPSQWSEAIDRTADKIGVPTGTVEKAVVGAADRWTDDPRRASRNQLNNATVVRARLEAAAAEPTERWATFAYSLDPRLTGQSDWSATAAMLQQAHDIGHDVPELTRQLVDNNPLGDTPAQDLRYRLAGRLPEEGDPVRATEQPAPRRHDVARSRQVATSVGPRSGVGPAR